MLRTVAFDFDLCLLHLLEKIPISDHSSSVSYFPTSFIQARDDSDDCPFGDVGQLCDLLEWLDVRDSISSTAVRSWSTYHSPCPLIDNFHQAEFQSRLEVWRRDSMCYLRSLDPISDFQNHLLSLYEFGRDHRLVV